MCEEVLPILGAIGVATTRIPSTVVVTPSLNKLLWETLQSRRVQFLSFKKLFRQLHGCSEAYNHARGSAEVNKALIHRMIL